MAAYTVGNDIIDLRKEEPPFHTRYLKRVLSRKEQEEVKKDPHTFPLYWAAKEAAYKAVLRIRKDLFFSPGSISVNLKESKIYIKDYLLNCFFSVNENFIACTAMMEEEVKDNIITFFCKLKENASSASEAVRKGLLEEARRIFKLDLERLEIVYEYSLMGGRIPVLLVNSEKRYPISFSHDGEYVMGSILLKEL